jgi:hypothetical protein
LNSNPCTTKKKKKEREREGKRERKNKQKDPIRNVIVINAIISIISLNVNNINIVIKR